MAETLTLFEEIFSDTGLLSKSLSSYESREGQKEMARNIWQAFEEESHALFEAGTGIGKSLAYLIPSLLWSYKTGEKVVISTYTISLQEQLLEKDIPMLLNLLGIDLRVVIAKGMGNYLCKRRLKEMEDQNALFEEEDAIVKWSNQTGDGSKSSLPFHVSSELFGKINAESESCSYVKCPHYQSCFFFKARNALQYADIIIVNHHLLMSHLLNEEKRAILPPITRLIVDEAHHLETVARGALTATLDRAQLFRSMARVHSDNHLEVSRFLHLRDIVPENKKSLGIRLGIDLPGEKRQLITKIQTAFDMLHDYFLNSTNMQRWRLTPQHFISRDWGDGLIPAFQEVKMALTRYIASLDSLEGDFKEDERAEGALLDVASCSERLKETVRTIDAFFDEEDEDGVRWIERGYEGSALSLAKRDVAPFLEQTLFSLLKTTVLCSATLTVGGGFDHLEKNLGISAKTKKIHPSPFDFQERTRLFGISDLPPPNGYTFISEAALAIDAAIAASGGGAFVLFTSYDMLEKCAKAMKTKSLLKQGDLSRHLLLEEFKERKNGVLLGTDSFWEGVDVAGDALRLVIIVKLPFPVPSDPLLEARAEALKKEGRDPFLEYSVPQAVMKFKQGFGRLMRRKTDRGCVLCLDQRLFNRSYGKIFLKSLPECTTAFEPKREIIDAMKTFYRFGA